MRVGHGTKIRILVWHVGRFLDAGVYSTSTLNPPLAGSREKMFCVRTARLEDTCLRVALAGGVPQQEDTSLLRALQALCL